MISSPTAAASAIGQSLADMLEQARACCLHRPLYLGRYDADDPVIVESWI